MRGSVGGDEVALFQTRRATFARRVVGWGTLNLR